jgi:hypothetical protein
LDAALRRRWHGPNDKPSGPIGVRRRRTP